jgi:hypothetical protein
LPVRDGLGVTEVAKGPTLTDWVYAAGFVDGEGCIAIARAFVPGRERYYYSVQVVVANRDREVFDWMQSVWGGWVVSVSRGQERARPAWHWRCPTGISAKPFLLGIQPWLRIKGPQCVNALAMIDLSARSRRTLGPYPLPREWLAEQEALYWIQRKLNHRGNADFIKQPMHSPRRINREKAAAATFGL